MAQMSYLALQEIFDTTPAAGNITETAADDISTVIGATAMTLFVQQPQNLRQQLANAQIVRSPHSLVTGIAASTLFIRQWLLICRH